MTRKDWRYVTIPITQPDLDTLDTFWKDQGFKSRSDYVRHALAYYRNQLERWRIT